MNLDLHLQGKIFVGFVWVLFGSFCLIFIYILKPKCYVFVGFDFLKVEDVKYVLLFNFLHRFEVQMLVFVGFSFLKV